MKSLAMVSYWFPPEGAAGVYRSLRFVRHLPSHGWQPVVIADDPHCYVRYDPGLLDLVPSNTEIIRVKNPDPWNALQQRRSYRIRQKIENENSETAKRIHASHQRPLRSYLRGVVRNLEPVVYRPDEAMFWIRPATDAVIRACKRTDAQVVWSTGGPWSALVVARNVWRRTGIPYVLDLRDAWTLCYSDFHWRQPAWVRARDRRLLSRLFRDAQAVVIRYMSEAEAYWRAYPGALDPERVHLIPNGYEGQITSQQVPKGDRCTVLFTGFIGPYWSETMLEALARLKQTDPATVRKLRLVLIGEETDTIAETARRLDLADVIESSGTLTFSEVNEMQQRSHALLLLGWRPSRGHELGGSKIFGYLKSGKPIVAILPKDEQTRILRSVGVDTIAYAGSIDEIIGLFKRILDAWSSDSLQTLLPDASACEAYSADRQTQALVNALEGRPAEEPFRPGACAIPPSLDNLIGPSGWKRADRLLLGVSASERG